MSPRKAAPQPVPEVPTAPVVHQCRRCFRPLDPSRTVYCSTQCVELDDGQADRLASQLAALQSDHDRDAAAIEAEVARYASAKRRVLHDRRFDLDRLAAELAPMRARLDAAKAAGEARFALASDRPGTR